MLRKFLNGIFMFSIAKKDLKSKGFFQKNLMNCKKTARSQVPLFGNCTRKLDAKAAKCFVPKKKTNFGMKNGKIRFLLNNEKILFRDAGFPPFFHDTPGFETRYP